MSTKTWPAELVFKREARVLHIAFDDGATADIPFEKLRTESPSAEVQGHGNKRVVTGKANVGIVDAKPVGRYAVRIVFDDGHDTGIFSWDYLRELGGVR
ncbi:MAG: DUF971 domain-containing protein [Hyphomonadaceae bacterium]|nr:MAG: hypothetical protein FD160_2973 [Caulobacteraceae bacterium]MBT9446078.1 DUF971 domain-containing protein [Hyphomonadaceae bacterium]TPW03637.1 MAG: hypothetical protein FD124_2944 [Alphaproteobacteria bacterium]